MAINAADVLFMARAPSLADLRLYAALFCERNPARSGWHSSRPLEKLACTSTGFRRDAGRVRFPLRIEQHEVTSHRQRLIRRAREGEAVVVVFQTGLVENAARFGQRAGDDDELLEPLELAHGALERNETGGVD